MPSFTSISIVQTTVYNCSWTWLAAVLIDDNVAVSHDCDLSSVKRFGFESAAGSGCFEDTSTCQLNFKSYIFTPIWTGEMWYIHLSLLNLQLRPTRYHHCALQIAWRLPRLHCHFGIVTCAKPTAWTAGPVSAHRLKSVPVSFSVNAIIYFSLHCADDSSQLQLNLACSGFDRW